MALTVVVTKGYDWKQGEYYSAAKLNVTDTVTVTGAGTFDVPARVPTLTVATLPAAASYGGGIAYVTDANATTRLSVVAAGGANKVLVYSDSTNWLIA